MTVMVNVIHVFDIDSYCLVTNQRFRLLDT